ncbi:hypothetical protein M9H77_12651 [Catharanthus roseus]|uniref:Uncharacterized protein n=1 Tax=Catharanthus roseus TaxID=4058 RepID=A0ACC0BI33_CATRO|nr:hypothetical protein M9H77_12651 [Catharanthus roseus]
MEKELGNFRKDLPISLSLISSLMCYEVSLVGLELFFESYLSHEFLLKDFEDRMGANLELFKNQEANEVNQKKFGMALLVFDPGGWVGIPWISLILGVGVRLKKIKDNDGNEANGTVAYLEEALKNKLEGFEDHEKVSKLFSICSISKDHSREQVGRETWLSVGEELLYRRRKSMKNNTEGLHDEEELPSCSIEENQ